MNRIACLRALVATPLFAVATAASAEQPNEPQVVGSQLKTPAQQRYGMPRNPIVGGKVDVDLSKPLSLNRAIQIGLALQNSIAISQTQLDSASNRLIQARAAYLPQVTPRLQYNTNLQPGGVINFGGNLFRASSTSEIFSNGVNATYNIFDMGQRETQVGSSRRNVFASAYGLGNQRQNVILSVTEDFYNLARDKELVKVQDESVKRAQTNLDIIEAQVKVGSAARSDTLQAEADFANAQIALLQAINNFNISQANLKNSMGVVTSDPLVLESSDILPPSVAPDTRGVEDYIKVAYTNRLDIRQQQERIYAQGYQVKSASINSGLQVNANVTQGYQSDPNPGLNRTFTVVFTYPLFDGGASRAAVRENKANLEQERRNLDQLEQTVRLNVEQSWLVRELARRRITASQTAVRAGELNFQAAQERQKNGLINVLDLITAQVQLVNAQVAYVQAIYDFYVADARLLRNVGLNDPRYKPPVPGAKPITSNLLNGGSSVATAFTTTPFKSGADVPNTDTTPETGRK